MCWKCNLLGYFSYVCDNKVCFNCECIGYEVNFCLVLFLCNFCKYDGYFSCDCIYFWVLFIVCGEYIDEMVQVIVDDNDDVGSGFEICFDDFFQWVEDLDFFDEYVDGVEELFFVVVLLFYFQLFFEVFVE